MIVSRVARRRRCRDLSHYCSFFLLPEQSDFHCSVLIRLHTYRPEILQILQHIKWAGLNTPRAPSVNMSESWYPRRTDLGLQNKSQSNGVSLELCVLRAGLVDLRRAQRKDSLDETLSKGFF